MMRFLMACLVAMFSATVPAQGQPATTATDSPTTPSLSTELFPPAGTIRVIETNEEIKKLLAGHGAEVLVVNFWATWCGPCVAELPYFIRLANKHPQSKVRLLGLSLDFPDQIDSTVVPFLRNRQIPYSNLIIYPDNPTDVIEFFSESWSGELPATFFFNKEGKKIGELPFVLTEEQLNTAVDALLAGQPMPRIERTDR